MTEIIQQGLSRSFPTSKHDNTLTVAVSPGWFKHNNTMTRRDSRMHIYCFPCKIPELQEQNNHLICWQISSHSHDDVTTFYCEIAKFSIWFHPQYIQLPNFSVTYKKIPDIKIKKNQTNFPILVFLNHFSTHLFVIVNILCFSMYFLLNIM